MFIAFKMLWLMNGLLMSDEDSDIVKKTSIQRKYSERMNCSKLAETNGEACEEEPYEK